MYLVVVANPKLAHPTMFSIRLESERFCFFLLSRQTQFVGDVVEGGKEDPVERSHRG